MAPLDIPRLAPGDRVQHELLVRERDDKTTKAGDPFVVYPGPDGPVDSLRWEVFAASLQDYALLQEAGVRPGRTVNAELDGTVLRLVGEGGVPHTVEAEVAHHLFVDSGDQMTATGFR